jgi:hypothetical protein
MFRRRVNAAIAGSAVIDISHSTRDMKESTTRNTAVIKGHFLAWHDAVVAHAA